MSIYTIIIEFFKFLNNFIVNLLLKIGIKYLPDNISKEEIKPSLER